MTEKPTLEYGKARRRWRWWDTLFLLAVVAILGSIVCPAFVTWGIFDVRISLDH